MTDKEIWKEGRRIAKIKGKITDEQRVIYGRYEELKDQRWRMAAIILAPIALAASLMRLLLQVLSLI